MFALFEVLDHLEIIAYWAVVLVGFALVMSRLHASGKLAEMTMTAQRKLFHALALSLFLPVS